MQKSTVTAVSIALTEASLAAPYPWLVSDPKRSAFLNMVDQILGLTMEPPGPREMKILGSGVDGSGWRHGCCSGCGKSTLVYEWSTCEVGGDTFLDLCGPCNGYRVYQENGKWFYVNA